MAVVFFAADVLAAVFFVVVVLAAVFLADAVFAAGFFSDVFTAEVFDVVFEAVLVSVLPFAFAYFRFRLA